MTLLNKIKTIDSFKQFAAICPQFENFRRGLAKIHLKEIPLQPKTLFSRLFLTSNNQTFLLFDIQDENRIILQISQSTQWHRD